MPGLTAVTGGRLVRQFGGSQTFRVSLGLATRL